MKLYIFYKRRIYLSSVGFFVTSITLMAHCYWQSDFQDLLTNEKDLVELVSDLTTPEDYETTYQPDNDWPSIVKINYKRTLFSLSNKRRFKNKKFHRKRKKKHPIQRNYRKLPIVEDNIFWAKEIERLTPQGISDAEVIHHVQKLRNLELVNSEPAMWNKCGRPKNQFITLSDGSFLCARYRKPHDYLVQGEVLSFYLSRLLGIFNVPVVALASVGRGTRWENPTVKMILKYAGWETNATVAFIQWIEHLERDRMPDVLLDALTQKWTLHSNNPLLKNLTDSQLVELLQWSDLVIFDYITGNYDRVASMQDAAEKESKPSILKETIHNLARCKTTGGLWLIDNESGLLDSYSLMYGANSSPESGDVRFIEFHQSMLHSTCIFRQSTVRKLERLRRQSDPHMFLVNFARNQEPLLSNCSHGWREFSTHFRRRLDEVSNHINNCRLGMT